MISPLHAAHYADQAWHGTAEVMENIALAKDTYCLRIECPELARRIMPGQFVMLRLTECNDPLLARPLALYDTVLSAAGEPIGVDLVYLVVGKLTGRLAQLHDAGSLEVWGPLGNGFLPQPTEHLIMVAGGIGQTPFPALAREALGGRRYGDPPREVSPVKKVTLCYGARNAEYLAGLDDFQQLGIDLRISTDDGTAGHHGLVTELLEQTLDESLERADGSCRIVCCGPEPMMQAVAEIALRRQVPCQVSLETPMACGIGICFSCVAKVRQPSGEWDYKRTCVEGPVFDAEKIVF